MVLSTNLNSLRLTNRFAGLVIGISLALFLQPAIASYQGPGLYRQAMGGTITLNQDIQVNQGVRIHIQNGRVEDFKEITKAEPYCYFYSTRGKDRLKDPFQVKQAKFVVSDVIRRREIVLSSPIQVASFGGSFFNGGGVQYTMATKFLLGDTRQSDLDSLICSVWADPRDRSYVTYDEINETLGDVASMELASQ